MRTLIVRVEESVPATARRVLKIASELARPELGRNSRRSRKRLEICLPERFEVLPSFRRAAFSPFFRNGQADFGEISFPL